MKKHNTLKVVLLTLSIFLVLSWVFTAAYFSGGYVDQGRIQMGLFDIFSYPVTAISYFGYIALFVLAIGMFYGVLNKTSAYRLLLDKMVKAFKGKEKIVISIIMGLFAVLTSVCGLQYALLLLFPLVISLVLMMGYDKIVAALTTVGSVIVGFIGTTFAYNNTSILANYLNLKVTSGIWYKVSLLVVGIALLIFNTMLYINKKMPKKQKNDSKDLEKYVPEVVDTKSSKKVRVWPLILVIDLILVCTILGFIAWSPVFNVTVFDDATKAITGFTVPAYIGLIVLLILINIVIFAFKKNKHAYIIDAAALVVTIVIFIGRFAVKAKVFKTLTKALTSDFAIFGKALGSVKSFGNWSLTEVSLLLIVGALIIALIYKVKGDDVFDGMLDGLKKALVPAILTVLVYVGLVIVTYHPFQLPMYKAILGLTKGFNIFVSSIVAVIATVFNGDPLYVFNSVIPYLLSLVTDTSIYPVIWLVYQSVSGLTMLVAPTSLVLLVTLYYLDIPYSKWLKSVWVFALQLLVVILVIAVIALA